MRDASIFAVRRFASSSCHYKKSFLFLRIKITGKTRHVILKNSVVSTHQNDGKNVSYHKNLLKVHLFIYLFCILVNVE
jgi:hypothetical protein